MVVGCELGASSLARASAGVHLNTGGFRPELDVLVLRICRHSPADSPKLACIQPETPLKFRPDSGET
eukprot:12033737-Alexandrium_andersonii.AAC.1